MQVYDVQSDKWSTFPGLPYEYQVSDHGGFPNHDAKEAYFCGGYLADYGTVGTCFSIDTVQSLANLLDGTNSSTPVTTARADMKLRRGDITIGSDANGAIATGGYSNATNWCEPYSQTEMYSFATESWTLQGNMDVARGDNALVELNGRIYVIGGEREIPDICELRDSGNLPGPDQQRLTIDDIEVFDRNGGEWTSLEDLPDNRFRFAAVAYDNPSRIYAFGGQLAYNATCNCTPTTSEVTVYTEKFGSSVPTPTGSDNGPTPTAVSAPSSPTTASAPSSPTPASAPTSDAAKASLLSIFGRIDPIMTAVVLILSIAVVL